MKAYRSEMRGITKDLSHARELMRAVELSSITADDLIKAAQGAFSGRLTIIDPKTRTDELRAKLARTGDEHIQRILRASITSEAAAPVRVDYVTGQYFPTEYRRAVCAVLASALWDYVREHCMPAIGAYRVESWEQLGKGRTRHTVVANREAAEIQLIDLGGSAYGSVCELYSQRGPCERITWVSAGEWLRNHFRQQFGRGIASRWFS